MSHSPNAHGEGDAHAHGHGHGHHGGVVVEHVLHLPKKRTIIKNRVGCVRTSTYDLPGDDFVFGQKNIRTGEGAGDLISNWVTANPSLEKKSAKMIVYSNVLAVKKGCITAKSMRQYCIDHPNIRMKEILLNTDSTRVDGRHEGPFGIKTKFADERMDDLLQAKYTDFRNEDSDYPNVQTIKTKGFMPESKDTIASKSIVMARKKAEEEREHHQHRFIMKKFQNVKGTFERQREEAQARRQATGELALSSPESSDRRSGYESA
mmetsp:Transcript_36442/g.27025  ORF Transcript_36442/g.27025 Transcript_36442/m.27025 type:complete len:263 (-) Transcript_36442:48-836(-)